MLVLGAFPDFAKTPVVAVLLATFRVTARGLNVSVGPRVNPSRLGDCQGPDPFPHIRLEEFCPVGSSVRESFSRLLALDARAGIGNISQAREFDGLLWINNCLSAICKASSDTSNDPFRTRFHKVTLRPHGR
jgi:hypothetical protein